MEKIWEENKRACPSCDFDEDREEYICMFQSAEHTVPCYFHNCPVLYWIQAFKAS